MLNPKYLKKAIFETIYLWQHSEHKYSKSINEAVNSSEVSQEFIQTFASFLQQYGIRRNILGEPNPKSGEKPHVTQLWRALKEDLKLFYNIDQDETNFAPVVDLVANQLKNDYGKLTRNQLPLSLVSKIAFMYSPGRIPILDKLAVEAIRRYYISGNRRPPVNNYQQYYNLYRQFADEHVHTLERLAKDFGPTMDMLPEWEMDNRVKFLANRSVDKLLWFVGKNEL